MCHIAVHGVGCGLSLHMYVCVLTVFCSSVSPTYTRTNRDLVWCVDCGLVGPIAPCIRWGHGFPHENEGYRVILKHAQTCLWSMFLTLFARGSSDAISSTSTVAICYFYSCYYYLRRYVVHAAEQSVSFPAKLKLLADLQLVIYVRSVRVRL